MQLRHSSTLPQSKFYIISDNFYPKKLNDYTCHTLTNIKVKTTRMNEIIVFSTRKSANTKLESCGYEGYEVHSIYHDELKTLCDCFDMKMKYE